MTLGDFRERESPMVKYSQFNSQKMPLTQSALQDLGLAATKMNFVIY